MNGTTKRCTKCNNEYPATLDFFTAQPRNNNGLFSWCRSCQRQHSKKWRESNRIKHREYSACYQSSHPDEARKKKRCWQKANPENCRAKTHRRRALKAKVGGSYTVTDVQQIGNSQRWLCWWCGKPCGDEYHIDHRVPLSKGGTNWPGNLVISCPHCNVSKGAKMPHEFNGRLLQWPGQ